MMCCLRESLVCSCTRHSGSSGEVSIISFTLYCMTSFCFMAVVSGLFVGPLPCLVSPSGMDSLASVISASGAVLTSIS